MKNIIVLLIIGVLNGALLLLVKKYYDFETAVIAGIAIITTYIVSAAIEIKNK